MNRLKPDQKTKVGKRKQDSDEMMSEAETDVKKHRVQQMCDNTFRCDSTPSGLGMPQTHLSCASSSSQGLAQSTVLSKKLPKNREFLLRQFVQWTQATESVSVNFLAKANWNIEYAMTLYFDNPQLFSGSTAQPSVDRSKVEKLFYEFVDSRDSVGEKRMGPHGVLRLISSLGYNPTDRQVLVLAFKFNAQTQCEFSLDEWVQGFSTLQVDSIQGLRQKIDAANAEMNTNTDRLRELYVFAFSYGKAASCRALDLQTAICYWDVLYGARSALLSEWINFLQGQEQKASSRLEQELGPANARKIKSLWIPRDTWNLFWDFMLNTKPDLTDYEDEGAWPVLIDQFVDHCRENRNYPKPHNAEDQRVEQYY